MQTPINVSALPAPAQEEVSTFLKEKLQAALNQEEELKKQLAATRETVAAYKKLLEQFGLSISVPVSSKRTASPKAGGPLQVTQEETIPSSDEAYNLSWTYTQKILYVLGRPFEHGVSTFLGASSVVDAIVGEEKKLSQEISKDDLKNIPATLSRLVKKGAVLKFLEKGSLAKWHFVRPDWFEDGKIKAEHAAAVKNLQLRGKKKSATVRAVAEAETETHKAEPSIDAEENSSDSISQTRKNLQLFEV